MSTFLVTGGCGFIGSHLADALAVSGHRVRILDNLSTGKRENAPAGAEIVVGDVSDDGTVRRAMAGADGCFHLAAVSSVELGNQDWPGTHRANLSGTIAVFDAARARKTPVVFASSAAVYGDNPAVPLAEDAATKPLSAYGADKLGCELHARVASHVHSVPAVGLRFFNVFGPRQDPSSPYSGVISIFCDRFRAGKGVTIFGDGGQTRDFVYVGDVVRALLAAMDRLPRDPAVFNVCTGRATSVLDLAKTIAGICRVEPRIELAPPRAGEIRQSFGDAARTARHLGVKAETDLRTGLSRTLGLA